MKPIWIAILIALVIGNLIGGYILYKALNLRAENQLLNKYLEGLTEKNQLLSDDFPANSVFQEANVELLNSTTPEERRKMCILYGASITKAWPIEQAPDGTRLIKRGIGSQSSTQLLARFSSDVLQLNPGRVAVKICAGNFEPEASSETIWDEFETMVLVAQARGIEPIITTIVPVTRAAEHFDGYSITAEVKKFNTRAKELARAHQFKVIDYFAACADSEGYLPDQWARDAIHPNELGYEKMTAAIAKVLK